jgi:outer membrane receptor for ferrienterochelin and colicin
VDLQSRYRLTLPERIGDSLDFGLNWTYLTKFEMTSPGSPTQTYVGQIGYPKNRGSLQIDYDGHGVTVGWTIRYQSAMKDQVNPDYVSASQAPFNSVSAYTYHDVQLRYDFGDKTDKMRPSVYGGIRNVFNKQPPFLPSGMTNQVTGTETAPDSYDAIGRQFFLGVEVKL